MHKTMTAVTLALTLSTSASFAKESSKSGEFYFITKALMTTAETITEDNEVQIEGKTGGGVGIDIGYTLPYHFAMELDTSYDKNDIREKRTVHEENEEKIEIEDAQGTYWTYAVDLTYTLPVSHSIGLMAKIGYELEHETISKLNIDAQDSGMVYGAGVEYHLLEHYEALVEYEGSMIESPRGSSIYAGVKYIF